MREFLRDLKEDKIKINWNKKPIKMDLFLSFLTITTTREQDFLGCHNGWTQIKGPNNFVLRGGIIDGVEYLDNIQYGKNLDNPYNNYVNPFYLFEIMTDEGKAFFLDYYKEDIQALLDKCDADAKRTREKKERTDEFWDTLGFNKI